MGPFEPVTRLAAPVCARAAAPRARLARRVERRRRAGAAGARPGARLASPSRSTPGSTSPPRCSPRAAADDRFFCFEQPDRDGLRARRAGPGRRARGARAGPLRARSPRAARELGAAHVRRRRRRRPRRARRAPGPVFVGGFAFADDGGASPEWSLARAGLARAARGLAGAPPRRGAHDGLRWSSTATRRPRRVLERARASAWPSSRRPPMPLLDPDPVERTTRGQRGPARRTTSTPWSAPSSASAPASSRRSCSRARCACTPPASTTRPPCSARCARSSRPASAGASARPELAFVGASPELLVRRDGARAQTVALAGTTRPQRRPGRGRPPRRAARRAAPRTARSRRSWRAGSSARSSRSASG